MTGTWYYCNCRKGTCSSVGWLPMYWSLDKGYLVYLLTVAYLQHWNWPFAFSTAKEPWLHMAQKMYWFGIQSSQGQNWTIFQATAVWVLFIFEVKGESSSIVQSLVQSMVQSRVHSPGFTPAPHFCLLVRIWIVPGPDKTFVNLHREKTAVLWYTNYKISDPARMHTGADLGWKSTQNGELIRVWQRCRITTSSNCDALLLPW